MRSVVRWRALRSGHYRGARASETRSIPGTAFGRSICPAHGVYDVEVDTGSSDPEHCVEDVISRMKKALVPHLISSARNFCCPNRGLPRVDSAKFLPLVGLVSGIAMRFLSRSKVIGQ